MDIFLGHLIFLVWLSLPGGHHCPGLGGPWFSTAAPTSGAHWGHSGTLTNRGTLSVVSDQHSTVSLQLTANWPGLVTLSSQPRGAGGASCHSRKCRLSREHCPSLMENVRVASRPPKPPFWPPMFSKHSEMAGHNLRRPGALSLTAHFLTDNQGAGVCVDSVLGVSTDRSRSLQARPHTCGAAGPASALGFPILSPCKEMGLP